MSGFIIGLLTFGLLLLSAFIVLLILMQRPSANAGMGAALGGGAAESVFGGEATNVLTRWTIYSLIAFFILSLGLSLIHMARQKKPEVANAALPTIVEKAPAEKSLTEVDGE